MKKIVVIQPAGLTESQLAELRELGDVKKFVGKVRPPKPSELPE